MFKFEYSSYKVLFARYIDFEVGLNFIVACICFMFYFMYVLFIYLHVR